jgi:predicted O-methyltransferase YrrM
MASPGQQYSVDWFDHNIPHWETWLAPLAGKPGLRALEIGSFEGRSTTWLFQNILTSHDSHIDCLDLFKANAAYGDYHERFQANTAAWKERISEYHGPSYDSLKLLAGPYDIVYVDGWHSAFGAMADGLMAWPMLNVGGVMIFDDYLWAPPRMGPPPRPSWWIRKWEKLRGRDWRTRALLKQIDTVKLDTPKLGVDGLLATLEGRYELLGITNQLAVRKTRDFKLVTVGVDT